MESRWWPWGLIVNAWAQLELTDALQAWLALNPWENSQHYCDATNGTTPPPVSTWNDVWATSKEIPFWWYVSRSGGCISLLTYSMWFCTLIVPETSVIHHFGLKPEVVLQNLSSFLRLMHSPGDLHHAIRNRGRFSMMDSFHDLQDTERNRGKIATYSTGHTCTLISVGTTVIWKMVASMTNALMWKHKAWQNPITFSFYQLN